MDPCELHKIQQDQAQGPACLSGKSRAQIQAEWIDASPGVKKLGLFVD